MDLLKRRWTVLFASCFAIICSGSMYSWSAYATQEAAYLTQCTGVEVTNLAIVFTVANGIAPFTMIAAGYIVRKIGVKRIIVLGGIILAVGMFLSGLSKSVIAVTLSFTLATGIGGTFMYGTLVANTIKLFPDERGVAGGLITACFGSGAIIMPPIVTAITEATHVTTTFKIFGIAMLIIVIVASFFIETCPDDFSVGAKPDTNAENDDVTKTKITVKDYKSSEMLKSGDFYLMIAIFFCGTFSGMMVLPQASQIAQNMMGFSIPTAALMVSLVAVFNTVSRIVTGMISDKLGVTKTLGIVFCVTIVANVLLYFVKPSGIFLFIACFALVGFCFGSIMGVYPGFTQKRFGNKYSGTNYGIMFLAMAASGIFAPMAMNMLYGVTGVYQPAFLVSAVAALIGGLLLLIIRKKGITY